MMQRRALVLGGCGFIGSHLSARLVAEGYETVLVDLKELEFRDLLPNETFVKGDLRDPYVTDNLFGHGADECYQFAALMGGMGWICGDNDADIMASSAAININVLNALAKHSPETKIFWSSSACIYPEQNQVDSLDPNCEESTAWQSPPDSMYGVEKLFSERLYQSFARNKGIQVRVARYHNVYGELGTYQGGKEKAPAALCRKIALAKDGTSIDVWGSGHQTRSFLHVSECVEGTLRLMRSDFEGPVNVGSTEMVTIDELARMIIGISGKRLSINHVPGPVGVNGRCSHNALIRERLGWEPTSKLMDHLPDVYRWVERQVRG